MKKSGPHLAAAALFVALSAVMLWPLPRLITRAIAHPSEPYVNTWVYDWAWHATTHRGASLFRANALHPDGPSLAFTEHQYGIALFGFPFRLAGASPLLMHNILLLLGFAFTGYGAFVLTRVVTGSWWAGIASGVFLAFVPWRFTHLMQTQHSWAGWLPLMIAALIAFARTPTWQRAALFGIAFFMNGITNLHWMAFGSLAIAVAALIFLIRRPRALLLLAASTVIATLLLIPFLLPYREVRERYGFRGDFDEAKRHSAVAKDWVTSKVLNGGMTDRERWLFPGVGGVLLALVGLIGPVGADKAIRRLVLIAAASWILLGYFGSLGLNGLFHRLLFDHVPLFSGIRAPARWAMIAYVGIALLAGIGAMKIVRHRHVAGAILTALLLLELRSAPLQFHLADDDEPPVYRWLAQSKDKGAILELPIRHSGSEYEYYLRATIHHRRMTNGVSDVGMHGDLVRAFEQRPVDLAILDQLAKIGVTTLVVHGDTLGEETAAIRHFLNRSMEAGKLRFVARFDRGIEGDFVFVLGSDAEKPSFGPQPASRPIGWLDEPQADSEVRGSVRVKGWAVSPMGIRRVRVFVNNRARSYEAQLFSRPDVGALYPWHDSTRAGFTVDIPRDREGATDVEVEITDAGGETIRLPQRWFVWSR